MRRRGGGLARTIKAFPTLLRIGVSETIAFRMEFLVWLLTATQPLVMMSLMAFIARGRSFHGYSGPAFVAYYLATLIVRQLTGNWVSWRLTEEIRLGTLAMRLLRPIHPYCSYLANQLAAIPIRAAIAVVLAAILLATSGAVALPHDPLQLALAPISILLAWLISFSVFFTIGSLAFFLTETMALGTVYFAVFSLFSGYLMPLDTLPAPIPTLAGWLPFKFMLAVPVTMLTRALPVADCLHMLLGQLLWVLLTLVLALWTWNRGIKRFESVGT
jgi:viologen exporter family transport system permease protein